LKNVIHAADIKRASDVELHEFETRLAAKMLDIAQAAGEKIVDTNNIMAFGQKGITKV
jgi:hypothetical protein